MVHFIRVPVHIWHMVELQPGQRMLLALVVGFTVSGKGCTMTNEGLSQTLGCSPRTVRRWLSDLNDRNLITITDQGGHRVAMGVDTAMSGGVDTAMSGGGGHSYGHHIRKRKEIDMNHHNNEREMKEMNRPSVADVTTYLLTVDRVRECALAVGDVRRMASDAVAYYEATEWRTKDGQPITTWRNVMRAWAKRQLKDVKAVQRRPAPSADEIRRDIAWHTKRRDNYEQTDRPHLAHSEQHSINILRDALDAAEKGEA